MFIIVHIRFIISGHISDNRYKKPSASYLEQGSRKRTSPYCQALYFPNPNISWGYLGHTLGISWAYLWHVLGTLYRCIVEKGQFKYWNGVFLGFIKPWVIFIDFTFWKGQPSNWNSLFAKLQIPPESGWLYIQAVVCSFVQFFGCSNPEILQTRTNISQIRPDQTRPDQTRPGQTRPDQTRSKIQKLKKVKFL